MTVLDDAVTLDWRARARVAAARALRRGSVYAVRARAHRVTLALPGVTGISLVSSAAGLAASYGGVTLGMAAGLGVLGVFLLRIDARL